jgi:hypothetical protein
MTIDELVLLRDHADAVVKIVGQTLQDKDRFTRSVPSPETTDKAIAFFLTIYPNSPLKVFR